MKKKLVALNELIYRIELAAGVMILIFIVLLVFLQVFNRFIIRQPLTWSEELSRYLFILLVFIGISVATKSKSHFGIDFIVRKLPRRLSRVMDVIVSVAVLSFLFIIFKESFLMIDLAMRQKSPALGITIGYLYYIFPLFSGFCSLHVITNLVEGLSKENDL